MEQVWVHCSIPAKFFKNFTSSDVFYFSAKFIQYTQSFLTIVGFLSVQRESRFVFVRVLRFTIIPVLYFSVSFVFMFVFFCFCVV